LTGALVNPWVFQEIRAGLDGTLLPQPPPLTERVAFMTWHFLRAVAFLGEHVACLQFRKMIDWYAKLFGPCRTLRKGIKELGSVAQFHDLVKHFLEERGAASIPRAPEVSSTL
jgi:tRNA-dihydrouridine synthase